MERKYQLTRIAAGDYVVPSNDATKLLRVCSYEEDGSASWQDKHGKLHPITGTHWAGYVYKGKFDVMGFAIPEDFLEWENWDCVVFGQPTRKVVLEDVLS